MGKSVVFDMAISFRYIDKRKVWNVCLIPLHCRDLKSGFLKARLEISHNFEASKSPLSIADMESTVVVQIGSIKSLTLILSSEILSY